MTMFYLCGPAVLVIAGLCLLFLKFPPEWVHELATPWSKVLKISTMYSILAMGVSQLHFREWGSYPRCAATLVMGLLTLLTISSMVTDWQVRKVDRRLLRVAMGIAACVNFPGFLHSSKGFQTTLFIIMLAVCMLFFSNVGASDVRALLFVVVGVIPLIGLDLFIMSIWLLIAVFVGYTLIEYLHENRTVKGYFTSKSNNVPMVPLILVPYMFLLPLS